MAIIKNKTQKDYSVLPNAPANDSDNLQLEDLGLLWYLASKSENWEGSVKDVCKRWGIGKKKAQGIFRRLREARYARLTTGGPGGGGGYDINAWRFPDSNQPSLFPEADVAGDPKSGRRKTRPATKAAAEKRVPNESKEHHESKEGKESTDSMWSFDDFWNIYDLKIGSKPKAQELWKKLPSEARAKIEASLHIYLERTYRRQKGEQADRVAVDPRKHPEFYLTSRYWEADYEALQEKRGTNGIAQTEEFRQLQEARANLAQVINEQWPELQLEFSVAIREAGKKIAPVLDEYKARIEKLKTLKHEA